MSDLLFEMPEQLSPRLAWMKRHMIRVHKSKHVPALPWCAWLPDNDTMGPKFDPVPEDPEKCGYGLTEDEALVDLAHRMKLKLWNEES